jgi:hypothetical protein
MADGLREGWLGPTRDRHRLRPNGCVVCLACEGGANLAMLLLWVQETIAALGI